jgi:hypothetical protein
MLLCCLSEFEHYNYEIIFLETPGQLRKLQALPELPRHFRKCLISAIACDIDKDKKNNLLWTFRICFVLLIEMYVREYSTRFNGL